VLIFGEAENDTNDTSLSPSPWDLVAQNADELTAVARDMVTSRGESVADDDNEVTNTRQLSHLEKLPQEIKLQIMRFLDHFSLYRLTQAYEVFHVLAFDNIFEDDPYWRTLRHTVDCLGDGPENRVLPQGTKGGASGGGGSGGNQTGLSNVSVEVEKRDRKVQDFG
jgi:hypothetical protein